MLMKLTTLRLTDEVNCRFIGMEKDDVKSLHEEFAVLTPNFYFTPAYRLGKWDGKIKFFSLRGTTYIHLLEKIVPRVRKLGYKIKILDGRKGLQTTPEPIDKNYYSQIPDVHTGNPTIFRDYQVEIVNTLIKEGNGIAVAATASGKTLCAAALCDLYGKHNLRTLTIVPDKNLIVQTRGVYLHYQLDVGEYSGERKDLSHTHIVSTWQSLQNNPAIMKLFQVVIVDECLDKNTKIKMADGRETSIKDIAIGDNVISFNIQTNSFETDEVIKIHKNISALENFYLLEFDNGQKIKITGNHKILTTSGYIRADKLTEDHEIIHL